MRRVSLYLLVLFLVAGCAVASTPGSGGAPGEMPAATAGPVTSPSTSPAAASPSTSPATTDRSAAPAADAPSAAPVTGWPTVSRAGVTMSGRVVDPRQVCEGCGAPPDVTLAIALTGLVPGDSIDLVATGDYHFGVLGCGVQPSPCEPGSGTTDPTVHLCRPVHSEAAQGTSRTTTSSTADAAGTGAATVRLVIPRSQDACPAGPSLPWYVESGAWTLRVSDRVHGLQLVIEPEDMIIGP